MASIDVSDSDFEEKVIKGSIPVLVDFWATWCGPCKLADPVLSELSDVYNGKLVVMKIDIDQNQATSQKYSVMSIPTTILFKNGVEIGRQIGFSGKQAYEDLVKKGVI